MFKNILSPMLNRSVSYRVRNALSSHRLASSTKPRFDSLRSLSSMAEQLSNVTAVGPDGKKYSIPLKPLGNYTSPRHAPKLAPRFKNARIAKLRTAEGKIKDIRHSPWRLNLVCQFVSGMTAPEALVQLKFCEKSKAPLVATLLQRTINTARQKHGLLPSQLEISECFATHGTHLKRIKIMGRGRAGKKLRRFSHMRLVLREIDFPLKIMTSTTLNQRQKWVKLMECALEDQELQKQEEEEIAALERQLEESRKEQRENNKE